MHENFQTPEELLADESFYSWYFKNDQQAVTAWDNWIKEDPARVALTDEAVKLLQELRLQEGTVPAAQIAVAYSRLQEQIRPTAPVVAIGRRRWWIAVAAAVILAVAGIGIIKYTGVFAPSVETSYGQIKEQQLPDGSEVTLNAHSKISYSDGWQEGEDREVWLNGEAFFHVKKTVQHSRFIVHTNRFDIIVTGTQFNVVNRNGKTNVLLKEGSVIVHTKDGKDVYMKPGDFVEADDIQLNKKQPEANSILAWKERKMVLDQTPMQTVAKMIEEHYGVQVILKDSAVASHKISGIMVNDNLETLLSALEATMEFKIERNGDDIIIRSNP
jgi:transmembrane sensor